MDYNTLQPGLARRLAYSRSLPRINTSPIPRRPIIIFQEPQNSFSYEVLSELKDIYIGLVSSELVKSTRVEINFIEENFCVVCQENISTNHFTDDCIMRTLPCNHCFHVKCIDNWFIGKKCCPTCKNEL
jgi:hypothetical protein